MKTRTAVIIGLFIILVVGIVVLVEHKRTASQEAKSQAARMTATLNQVKQANVSRPALQTRAKMLLVAAIVQKRIPKAANWCETLNAGGNIWPTTPTNTVFALNANVAGRAIMQGISGDTVVFFETTNPGWNQSGGAELLASDPDGVVVALADGRAMIVTPAEAANLRWTP